MQAMLLYVLKNMYTRNIKLKLFIKSLSKYNKQYSLKLNKKQ